MRWMLRNTNKALLHSTSMWRWSCPSLLDMLTDQQPASKRKRFRNCSYLMQLPRRSKTRKPASDRDVKVPLLCVGELAVSSIYAEKGDLNQREEVLTRQMCYSVHPRQNTGSQRNSKGEIKQTYPGRSRDTGTSIFVVATLTQG